MLRTLVRAKFLSLHQHWAPLGGLWPRLEVLVRRQQARRDRLLPRLRWRVKRQKQREQARLVQRLPLMRQTPLSLRYPRRHELRQRRFWRG